MPYPSGAKGHHRSTNDYNDLDPHLPAQYHPSAHSLVTVCQNSEPASATFGFLAWIQIALADRTDEVVNLQNSPKSADAREFRQSYTSAVVLYRS